VSGAGGQANGGRRMNDFFTIYMGIGFGLFLVYAFLRPRKEKEMTYKDYAFWLFLWPIGVAVFLKQWISSAVADLEFGLKTRKEGDNDKKELPGS
jgi:hypothetical protein